MTNQIVFLTLKRNVFLIKIVAYAAFSLLNYWNF